MLDNKKACCAILAGGKAERMPDKPFLLLNGKPLVCHVLEAAEEYFDGVIIVAKKEHENKLKKLMQNKNTELIIENSSEFSPWNGIKTAAESAKAEWIFLLACDMPFINAKLFDLLASKINPDIDCVIPQTDRLQPICALYRRSALANANKEGSLTRFAESLKREAVQIPEENSFWLFNINTKEDFGKAEGMMRNQTFKD